MLDDKNKDLSLLTLPFHIKDFTQSSLKHFRTAEIQPCCGTATGETIPQQQGRRKCGSLFHCDGQTQEFLPGKIIFFIGHTHRKSNPAPGLKLRGTGLLLCSTTRKSNLKRGEGVIDVIDEILASICA